MIPHDLVGVHAMHTFVNHQMLKHGFDVSVSSCFALFSAFIIIIDVHDVNKILIVSIKSKKTQNGPKKMQKYIFLVNYLHIPIICSNFAAGMRKCTDFVKFCNGIA